MILCTLYSQHDIMYTVKGTWYYVHCTVYMKLCTLCSQHDIMYTVQWTWYYVHCTVYMKLCTLFSQHDIMYTVKWTWYYVHCTVNMIQNFFLKVKVDSRFHKTFSKLNTNFLIAIIFKIPFSGWFSISRWDIVIIGIGIFYFKNKNS